MSIINNMDNTKEGIRDSFENLIHNAKDPYGMKVLMDHVWEDITKIGEIYKAEHDGSPIDLDEAERIEIEIDTFINGARGLPMLGTATKLMGIGKIQKDMHKHIAELREKAKTQGVVIHKLPEPSPTQAVSQPEIKVEPPKEEIIQKPTIETQATSSVEDLKSSLITQLTGKPKKEESLDNSIKVESDKELIPKVEESIQKGIILEKSKQDGNNVQQKAEEIQSPEVGNIAKSPSNQPEREEFHNRDARTGYVRPADSSEKEIKEAVSNFKIEEPILKETIKEITIEKENAVPLTHVTPPSNSQEGGNEVQGDPTPITEENEVTPNA